MSKEVWIRAYELNLDDGMSEEQAVKHADERAADIEAHLADEAWERYRENSDE